MLVFSTSLNPIEILRLGMHLSLHVFIGLRFLVICNQQILFLVLSYVYYKQPIFGLTQEWLRELSFSRLECGVHDKLHISRADWWDILLPLA